MNKQHTLINIFSDNYYVTYVTNKTYLQLLNAINNKYLFDFVFNNCYEFTESFSNILNNSNITDVCISVGKEILTINVLKQDASKSSITIQNVVIINSFLKDLNALSYNTENQVLINEENKNVQEIPIINKVNYKVYFIGR